MIIVIQVLTFFFEYTGIKEILTLNPVEIIQKETTKWLQP